MLTFNEFIAQPLDEHHVFDRAIYLNSWCLSTLYAYLLDYEYLSDLTNEAQIMLVLFVMEAEEI